MVGVCDIDLPVPAAIGFTVFPWALHTGAGVIGAIIVGFLSGSATLVLGQMILLFAKPTWVRVAVALAFVVPAVIAGCNAVLGISELMMPSSAWQHVFSVIGAAAVGVMALIRLVNGPLVE